MWFFNSPEVVYGEGALSYLAEIRGRRAFLVTDRTMAELGFVDRVAQELARAGIDVQTYDAVEPEPSPQAVRHGATLMLDFEPDWIIGLGGGSVLDAAKAMWVLYERPDMRPEAINPIERLGLRERARMIAIPTTSGTGSEATWAIVLTDTDEQRKLGLGSRECLPDIAILDPSLAARMPPRLTADTGLDALTHAIEGYTSRWHNDFSDGLCLKAVQLIFTCLPRAYANGDDMEAREHMHNAASLAGLGFINSMAGLAHGMGHPLGAMFKVPHGRSVGLFLPYTIEFAADVVGRRYSDVARAAGLEVPTEADGPTVLAQGIRNLMNAIDQPTTLNELQIDTEVLERKLSRLVSDAENDSQTLTSPRIPSDTDLEHLYRCALTGRPVDF
ncbi:MAG: iron-containing alcohol dehydrogenase [Anaerolineae bacterium]